jgi:formyltetrahydrofolate synthetase
VIGNPPIDRARRTTNIGRLVDVNEFQNQMGIDVDVLAERRATELLQQFEPSLIRSGPFASVTFGNQLSSILAKQAVKLRWRRQQLQGRRIQMAAVTPRAEENNNKL